MSGDKLRWRAINDSVTRSLNPKLKRKKIDIKTKWNEELIEISDVNRELMKRDQSDGQIHRPEDGDEADIEIIIVYASHNITLEMKLGEDERMERLILCCLRLRIIHHLWKPYSIG